MNIPFAELTSDAPVDTENPVRLLNGNTNLYYMMLGRLESMSLRPNIDAIGTAIDARDWTTVRIKAHGLKGACGYIGAVRLHYTCYFI
jgi:HPt (histidine-containing phosphotransfer) domain-containing protein